MQDDGAASVNFAKIETKEIKRNRVQLLKAPA